VTPANGKYLTAYSLQQRAGTRSYFAHFAEGLFGDPPRGLFTGLALYNNTRDQVAEILVEAYSPQNLPIGRAEFTLAAGRRLSRTPRQSVGTKTNRRDATQPWGRNPKKHRRDAEGAEERRDFNFFSVLTSFGDCS
jgi:hypothetical protein